MARHDSKTQSETNTNTVSEAELRANADAIVKSAAAQEAKAAETKPDATVSILKPSGFSLDKFRSQRPTSVGRVATLLGALPHHALSEARDYVRVHPDENAYWTPELCFVKVPIIGAKKDMAHLIEESLARTFLPAGRVERHGLALAAKPFNVFFLAHVPTVNLDNSWNESNLVASKLAKERWVVVTSQREAGIDRYKADFALEDDAFEAPKWPEDTLDALVEASFKGRMIDTEDHPALLRLTGRKQKLK
jgi:hypothetical protein